MTRPAWFDQAACRPPGPDGPFLTNLFYSAGDGVAAKARAICAGCPVRRECIVDSLATGDEHGIRAGRNYKERSRYARAHGVTRRETCLLPGCGVTFPADGRTRYCTDEHRQRAAEQRRQARRVAAS